MSTEGVLQYQSYLDLPAVKGWLQITPGNTQYDEPLKDILDMSCTWVQNYLGRPIAPTTIFKRFNGWTGWEGCYLTLPYAPVLSVTSVVEYWGVSGPHTLSEQTPQQQSNPTGYMGDTYTVERSTGLITRTFPGLIPRPFFPGHRNIEITWVAGYNPLPADLKIATLEVCAWWYRNTVEAVRYGRSTNAGSYDDVGPSGLWPAIPQRITALLEPYVQIGMS